MQTTLNQLRAVECYLNDAGKEHKDVLVTLLSYVNYCDTATELLEWIKSRKGMDKYDNQRLSSHHAQPYIRRLCRIAETAEKT